MSSKAAVVLFAFVMSIGCASADEDRSAAHVSASASPPAASGRAPRSDFLPVASTPPRASDPPVSPSARWLASTDGGASIALVSSASIVAKTPLPPGEVARDLVPDPLHDRALVFASNEEDGYGELVAIPVGPTSLGAAVHLAWIDGDARFATDGAILLAFERSYGDAWKRLDLQGATLPRWPAPPPLAVVPTAPGLGVLFVEDDGGLSLSRITSGGAWPPEVEPLGAPSSARLVASASGDPWLFEEVSGRISVRRAVAGSAPQPLGVDLAGGTLEAALSFDQGSRVALLASGLDVLITFTLGDDAVASDVERIEIGASPAPGGSFPTEALAVIGPTELGVATPLGVVAFRVTVGALTRDPVFDGASFSAPIASWP